MSGEASDRIEQLAYYRSAAGEYQDLDTLDVPGRDELFGAIAEFGPTGDVLELACGTGTWTEQLLRTATTVTAVDGAPEMLVRAQARVGANAAARFVEADLFSWRPDRRYDAILFGFWISHVPEEQFAAFWSMVADALQPGGEVFFFDDNHRSKEELVEGTTSSIVLRQLTDGSAFRVFKVPHEPSELEQRLRSMQWNIRVTGTAGSFYWGRGTR